MFFRSIRWRLQLWLAFLLVSVLSGFGVAIYQLQRLNQLKQIDEELERRVAVLSGALPVARLRNQGLHPHLLRKARATVTPIRVVNIRLHLGVVGAAAVSR